jgi:DNA repair protein RAD50
LDDSDKTKRNISDNLEYRYDLKQLEAIKAEITELRQKDAGADYERLQKEGERFQSKAQRYSAEQSTKLGTMNAKDAELGRLIDEWETDYKDAASRYREYHIKVEVRISFFFFSFGHRSRH